MDIQVHGFIKRRFYKNHGFIKPGFYNINPFLLTRYKNPGL